jgi:hypothetical protein
VAKFKGAILDCVVCGEKFKVPPSRADKAKACSPECGNKLRGISNSKERIKLNCALCERAFYEHESHAGRRVYCSRECRSKAPSWGGGASKGENNPMWRGGKTRHSMGYVYLRAHDHPFGGSAGYVFEHRIVMERWLLENYPESKYLVTLASGRFLDPTIIVHHRDGNKAHNTIENLECMTATEHASHHNSERLSK